MLSLLAQFHTFITEADFQNSILKYNSIASNIPSPTHFHEYFKSVLEENNKQNCIQEGKTFHKIQLKSLNLLRPLSKLPQKIEEVAESSSDSAETDLNQFRQWIEL